MANQGWQVLEFQNKYDILNRKPIYAFCGVVFNWVSLNICHENIIRII